MGCAHNRTWSCRYERPVSFEPGEINLERRLFDAYAAEVARVDPSHHGIITALVGDIDSPNHGFPNNERLYLPPTCSTALP
jgi:hypothetical protein